MKKCPTCDKEFPDSMRFCQIDGTSLVEIVQEDDPYKTVVARQDDIRSAIPPSDPFKTVVGGANKKDESGDLLQLPEEYDPLKTMYVSETDLRKEMSAKPEERAGKKEDLVELPPLAPPFGRSGDDAPVAPEPPKFNEPNISTPNFGDKSSPFSNQSAADDKTFQFSSEADNPPAEPPKYDSPFGEDKPKYKDSFGDASYDRPTGAIPSPFGEAKPTAYDPPSTPLPAYKEPEPDRTNNPFASPSSPFGQMNEPERELPRAPEQNAWTPPPAPDAGWQNREIGQNTPFQPPVNTGGQNQTLPIISLVLGIVSLCCYISPLTGIAALITGYLGMKNANNDPQNYSGKTLAIIGMILGGLFLLLGIVYWILIFLGLAANLANMPR